ncbi:MAG TPA: hypothetical protein VHY31_06875 [Streptosporangiaceae bacterium]|jgi:hypothetical protein|nr:hypothetical protein [Streptosporangiaceae bacterium]
MNDDVSRNGLVLSLCAVGGVLAVAGLLLAIVPLDHGTISQWNGLCTTGVGQLGQLLDPSARQDCGGVGLADHLIGWLLGCGIAALAAAAVLAVVRPRPGVSPAPPPEPGPAPGLGQPVRARRNPARRLAVIATAAALVAAGGAWVAIGTAASSSPALISFLCWNGPGDNGATLLQWPSGSVVSGTYRDASVSGTAPGEQVSTDSGALTGTVSGSNASLDLGGSGEMYGTLGRNLVLNVPQQDGTIQPVTCKPGTVAGWNSALSTLGTQTSTANAQASAQQQQQDVNDQITQADQQLTSDIATLTEDAQSLDNDKTLAGDIQQMQTDLATEQSDYQAELGDTCDDKSDDAGTVSDDAGSVSGDLSSLQDDEQSLQDNDVSQDLSAAASDAATVTNLGGTPQPDPTAAIKAGNKAVKDLSAAISWATSEGNSINGQAQQVASEAQAAANC